MTSSPSRIVPLVDLKRQYASIEEEVDREMKQALSSMQLFLGPNVRSFQSEFADFLGASHCVGVSDGTMAIYLALRACQVQPGDEVITVSHTFFATVEAIVLAGAIPVFVDVEPGTLLMDTSLIEAAITPRTKAILPVHLYGRMADMDTIMALAEKYDLRVIEDASQAHGARRNGKAAGTIGHAGTFSFYYSKNLGAYGEAGGVVTNDAEVARSVEMLRDHGSAVRYHHAAMGVNGRLDELQAAVLRVKLRHLESWNQARRGHAISYTAQLANLPIETPPTFADDHVFHLYVVETDHRDALQRHLNGAGVHAGIHYPVPCHKQSASTTQTASLPVTEAACDRILSLPIYPELQPEDIEYVTSAVKEYFDTHSMSDSADASEKAA